MSVILRYIFLLALGFGSFLAFVSATTATGQMFIAGNDLSTASQTSVGLWVLAIAAATGLSSVANFAFRRFPQMIVQWYGRNKERMVTLALGMLVCFVFIVS